MNDERFEIVRGPDGRFLPGHPTNPKGRPVGSRRRIAEEIITDLREDWEKHGAEVLDKLARDDPGKFAQLAIGILPRDILVSVEQRALPGSLEAEDDGSRAAVVGTWRRSCRRGCHADAGGLLAGAA